MKIKFEGTRGEIEEYSRKHRHHSSLLVEEGKFKLLIDHGVKTCSLERIKPDAILITHAHPDHFAWTKKNLQTNIPIYLTRQTFNYARFKPQNYNFIKPNKKFKLGPFTILPYKVIHSIRCPALGFKVSLNHKSLIYNPDLIDIVNKNKILKNVSLYIGDGSSIRSNLVRRKNNKLFGHTRIQTQINWCRKYKISNVIFTHFGKEALSFGDKKLEKKLKQIREKTKTKKS